MPSDSVATTSDAGSGLCSDAPVMVRMRWSSSDNSAQARPPPASSSGLHFSSVFECLLNFYNFIVFLFVFLLFSPILVSLFCHFAWFSCFPFLFPFSLCYLLCFILRAQSLFYYVISLLALHPTLACLFSPAWVIETPVSHPEPSYCKVTSIYSHQGSLMCCINLIKHWHRVIHWHKHEACFLRETWQPYFICCLVFFSHSMFYFFSVTQERPKKYSCVHPPVYVPLLMTSSFSTPFGSFRNIQYQICICFFITQETYLFCDDLFLSNKNINVFAISPCRYEI